MSFVAEASRTIPAPVQVAFDALLDHTKWREWMPRAFIPVSRLGRPLRKGDRIRVRVGGAPVSSAIHVTVVDRPYEITWCGGVRGVLYAEHRFLFEPGTNETTVRSLETWSGVLAPFVRFALQTGASRAASEQLAGLEKAIHEISPARS